MKTKEKRQIFALLGKRQALHIWLIQWWKKNKQNHMLLSTTCSIKDPAPKNRHLPVALSTNKSRKYKFMTLSKCIGRNG